MTLNLTIRRATLSDLPILQQMSAELIRSDAKYDPLLTDQWSTSKAGEKYLTSRVSGRKSVCFVAELNQQLIGYATGTILSFQQWRPVVKSELENLYVRFGHRNKEVGTSLLNAFISWSQEKGVERIVLHAVATNSRAIEFYERKNFIKHHVVLEATIK